MARFTVHLGYLEASKALCQCGVLICEIPYWSYQSAEDDCHLTYQLTKCFNPSLRGILGWY